MGLGATIVVAAGTVGLERVGRELVVGGIGGALAEGGLSRDEERVGNVDCLSFPTIW